MSDLVEYFVRHYTLVLDNDQGSYNAMRSLAREVMRESDVTLSQYRAMTAKDREAAFAAEIGSRIMTQLDEWIDDALESSSDSIGGLLIREIMITSDGEIAWALGANYLPEDGEADEYFTTEDDDDDEREVPEDFPVKVLGPDDTATDRVTCGECGRSWDDAIATPYTPAPSGRCPFEAFHEDSE